MFTGEVVFLVVLSLRDGDDTGDGRAIIKQEIFKTLEGAEECLRHECDPIVSRTLGMDRLEHSDYGTSIGLPCFTKGDFECYIAERKVRP
jgi:hypothetical protein